MSEGGSRVNALFELAERADADGDSALALGFLVRAGQRCWTSNLGERSSELVARALVRMDHLKRDPRVIVTRALASPLPERPRSWRCSAVRALRDSVDSSGLHLLGQAAACLGAFRETQDLLSAASEALREEGRLAALAAALRLLAWAALRRGQWDVAGPAAEECGRLAEETRQPMILADSLSVQAMLAALRGNMDESEGFAFPVGTAGPDGGGDAGDDSARASGAGGRSR